MNKIVAIYGPTTANKLGLALNISKYIWGKYRIEPEVVNVDSRKIYQGFIISQSLPTKAFLQKVKAHLFGTVSPEKKLDLYDFQRLVKEKINEIQTKGNLPILVGGSVLHLLAILQEWKKEKKTDSKTLPANILVLGLEVSRLALKKAINKSVSQMFKKGLYKEVKELFRKSQDGQIAPQLLEETWCYQQFIEMARVSGKSLENLTAQELVKVKTWIIKDMVDYTYHQILGYKKFPGIKIVGDFKQAREIVGDFIFPQKPGLRRCKE